MKYRSNRGRDYPGYANAVSEQDYIAVYSDTFATGAGLDELDHRKHSPLYVQVIQKSYSWSYPYAEDFVVFDYTVRNTGDEPLDQLYLGIYIFPSVMYTDLDLSAANPIVGFLGGHQSSFGDCTFADSLGLAWFAHCDGLFDSANPEREPTPHIAGIRFLGHLSGDRHLSYNWWVESWGGSRDWGPQTRRSYRNLQTGGLGKPAGDRNRYHFLRNGEIDYDAVRAQSIRPGDLTWMYPDQEAIAWFPCWNHPSYLLSVGPYDIEPGGEISIPFAYVMGKDFHRVPGNTQRNLVDNYDPDAFYENVDFSDIARNARWAEWIYDNPGFDTDGDGYAGEYRDCCQDSAIASIDSTVTPPDTVWSLNACERVWTSGDGVPDWRAISPPPPPRMIVEPSDNTLRIRFNGTYSETTKDIFLQKVDFEGYRVYYSRDARESSYSLLTSYDRENYDKFVWVPTRRVWELTTIPYSLKELRCYYGESCADSSFDPLTFTRSQPYFMPGFPDSTFYFTPHDFNRSEFGVTTQIRKVYPDQPYPSNLLPDSARADERTEDGLLKYFEYEYTIDGLLPTVGYYVNVTAFDFGAPQMGISPFETSKTLNAAFAYPTPNSQTAAEQNLKAYIYPNPYRINDDYYGKGFEGRDAEWYIPDRLRRIHFANLPARCTISIFSLDGDLVRQWDHDMDPNDPASSHDEWDLITRNTQRVVSGIYYWTVAEPNGKTQIGKLVIIK
ncbi:MAG: hypothetical protein PVF49_08970 [Anaerolineales bacterium]